MTPRDFLDVADELLDGIGEAGGVPLAEPITRPFTRPGTSFSTAGFWFPEVNKRTVICGCDFPIPDTPILIMPGQN